MPKGMWYDRTTWDPKTMDPANKKPDAAPTASVTEPEPAPAPKPEETTLVDEHSPVAPEPHGSHDVSKPATAGVEHEEHDDMTEDEINETSTEEPDEFWSIRKILILVGVLAVGFLIAVNLTSGHPWFLGLFAFGCFGGTFWFVRKAFEKGVSGITRLAYVVVALLGIIFGCIFFAAMAKGTAPVGPYGP